MFEVKFAERCCWRAAYLYRNGRQVAHIGIDPGGNTHDTLEVFGGVKGWEFRFPISKLGWRPDMGRVRYALFRLHEKARRRLDGRYQRVTA